MMLPRRGFLVLAATFAVLLGGCGPGVVNSNVLRFHTPQAYPIANRTFAVIPQETQRGSLEFQAYAEMVAKRMQALGYRPVPANANPDLAVLLHYAVDDGRTEIWTTPIYSYSDYWLRYYGASPWPYPYQDITGANTHSTTIFTHRLEMQIVEGDAHRAGRPSNLFEGRAVVERQARDIVGTIPYLMDAMFDGFPGPNGVPTTVSIPVKR